MNSSILPQNGKPKDTTSEADAWIERAGELADWKRWYRCDKCGEMQPCMERPFIRDFAISIYTGKAFEALPILADALEEAGCVCEAVLFHLRSPGLHVRGCWSLDFILGRE